MCWTGKGLKLRPTTLLARPGELAGLARAVNRKGTWHLRRLDPDTGQAGAAEPVQGMTLGWVWLAEAALILGAVVIPVFRILDAGRPEVPDRVVPNTR